MRILLKPVVFLAVFALAKGAVSDPPKEFKPPVKQVAPSLDKVQMVSFVSEPAQIAPGATQVVLRVTVKNVTNSNLAAGYVLNSVKVKILRTNPQPEVLELETTVNNLAAGASQSVAARVNIGPGVREYFARVDPDDTLHEPLVQRANNEKRLKLTIPQAGQPAPPAGSQPQLVTQLLDFDKAKRAGANFTNGLEGPSVCPTVGVFDVRDHPDASVTRPEQGVLFAADCHFILPSPSGARATPEAFTNFRLKNGWKVRSFEIVGVNKNGGDWQWRQVPQAGSSDPSMRMHLWANSGNWVWLSVKVTIEGPAGTDPYQ